MAYSIQDYIPAGCFVFSREDGHLPEDIWQQSQDYSQWQALTRDPEKGRLAQSNIGNAESAPPRPALPFEHQAVILRGVRIQFFERLFDEAWINLNFATFPGSQEKTHAVLRIYLLPDDVNRSIIDRSNAALAKARRALLSKLDFSRNTWHGRLDQPLRSSPQPQDPVEEDDESLSLLQLFNKIPAPDPAPDLIEESNHQFVVNSLLQSNVDGLSSLLFPYQRRSAAVMAMREAQPGQFLDPRLCRVLDQDGQGWYYDAPGNVVFKEPRYYDGVSGGILAEQMGAGKTLICLSLILATRSLPTRAPDFRAHVRPLRRHIGSLADMAAACATANGLPYRWYFDAAKSQDGWEYTNCLKTIARNPGVYEIPSPAPRRVGRMISRPLDIADPKKVLLSQTTIVLAPSNLVKQWQQEVKKHTKNVELYVVTKEDPHLSPEKLARYDIVLCPHNRLEAMVRQDPVGPLGRSALTGIHFKRCIVDEGHRLGTSSINTKSDFLRGLESLHVSSRWIVTGTPAKGLYGVDETSETVPNSHKILSEKEQRASQEQEKDDLEKLGAIAKLYLKARPWANATEEGEMPADWKVYVMQPKHSAKSTGRQSSLRATLNSLIIRHPLSELSHMLPEVDERVVVLEGSYQDKLSLNVFSMMTIFNAVQSQRTDQDYFFHPRQRKSLLQLVQNLKQASFFGGAFFSEKDIETSLDTAETFLEKRTVPIGEEDEALLRQAMRVAHVALANMLKLNSNLFHEMPIFVEDFLPGGASQAWSLDGNDSAQVSTNTTLVLNAQKIIRAAVTDDTELNSLLNGGLRQVGQDQKMSALESEDTTTESTTSGRRASASLAGNTKLGDDASPKTLRTNALHIPLTKETEAAKAEDHELPESLAKARLISTASAKMTYLLDSILEHCENEQIIVFYESESMAWHTSGMLDVVSFRLVCHLTSLEPRSTADS